MCQEDTWYVYAQGYCFNPVAHIVLCAVLILVSVLCIIKGILVLPHIVPRAKQILSFYIAVQVISVVLEAFGLVIFKIDSSGLRLFRFLVFSTLALLQYWGVIFRTVFFLETVASTQQYKTGGWTLIKSSLFILWLLYSGTIYLILVILPGALRNPLQRELCVRIATGIGATLQFSAMVLTALLGYRLLAVIQTVVDSGLGAQPARLAVAKENMIILREGLTKTIIAALIIVAVSIAGVIFGLHWIIMHIIVFSTHIAFIGAVSYLQTCKAETQRRHTVSKLGGKSYRQPSKVHHHRTGSHYAKRSIDDAGGKRSIENVGSNPNPHHDHAQSQHGSASSEEKGENGGGDGGARSDPTQPVSTTRSEENGEPQQHDEQHSELQQHNELQIVE